MKQQKIQFHKDEIAVQTKLGLAEQVASYGNGAIRQAMPEQHRQFFSDLPFVMLGIADREGVPWAIPVFGKTGFVSSPHDTCLRINALPRLRESLDLAFDNGQKVGMLGIQLHTRRRNRMNGVINNITKQGFDIDVDQSFGNCPKYIQNRKLEWSDNQHHDVDLSDILVSDTLNLESKSFLEQADTFFIASRTNTFNADVRTGVDVSHRGGKPGFVKVTNNKLSFPDFSGNKFFNTLGNITSDARVGLFFPDYDTGNAIFVAGRATIIWDGPTVNGFEGAERIIEVEVDKCTSIPNFMPLTGKLVDFSSVLESTGKWENLTATRDPEFKALTLTKKQKESDTISSFYFSPIHTSKTLDYIPGQYLPLQVNIHGEKNVKRNYTLSRAPVDGSYRISVKREEHGEVSRYLHDHLKIGDKVEAGLPAGKFTIAQNNHSVVLVSGGVGITPMMAMLGGIVSDVTQGKPIRPVWFIHATQHRKTLAFDQQLIALEREHAWLHVIRVFSRPLKSDVLGITYQFTGRLSGDLLKEILPFDLYDFYLCGSEGFMRLLYADLQQLGVSKSNIFYEFFGAGRIEESGMLVNKSVATKAKVTFSKSSISGEWTPEGGTLLEFAEKQGIAANFSCRSGNCGVCACTLVSGNVSYEQTPSFQIEDGQVLVCCAKPSNDNENLVIEI